MTEYLTVEQVIEIHDEMLRRYGGLQGIRDINLLHSSVLMPQTAAFGQEFYPSIYKKAAAYTFYIIRNHPFCDANKRTGYTTCLVFLKLNNIDLEFDKQNLEKLVIEIAAGRVEKDELAHFLQQQHAFHVT